MRCGKLIVGYKNNDKAIKLKINEKTNLSLWWSRNPS